MSYSVYVRRAAERDMAEAQKWYEDQQLGLAAQFNIEFNAALDKLAETPFIYPPGTATCAEPYCTESLFWSGTAFKILALPFSPARTARLAQTSCLRVWM